MDACRPDISVCIPAYNRADRLPELLDSILAQSPENTEVVICEDHSPERERIREVVTRYRETASVPIHYHENRKNLGYDGNLRHLIEKSNGRYCFFMGNDDLVAPGALATVTDLVNRHPDVGVILRSYASFADTPSQPTEYFRYFDTERFFPAGVDTVCVFFRRCVVISGLVLHRDTAHARATDRFDGTLLYQLYLVANLLTIMNGVASPEILALYRTGGIPDFGNSDSERHGFVPGQQTPESSLHFIHGMLGIARAVEKDLNMPIYRGILRDMGNYSYPLLSIQAGLPLRRFIGYTVSLARMGFWKSGLFYAYAALLMLIGKRRVDRLIRTVKHRLGHTPSLGAVLRKS